MIKNSLENFLHEIKSGWNERPEERPELARALTEQLVSDSKGEPWLAGLLQGASEGLNQELYRDPQFGFVLNAHSEQKGLYRSPHDHGNGWVVYAVLHGETEMRTYSRAVTPGGRVDLKLQDSYRMKAGDARLYLPGDIHDTRCMSDSVVMLRFTSCDLKVEDREGRMNRYPQVP